MDVLESSTGSTGSTIKITADWSVCYGYNYWYYYGRYDYHGRHWYYYGSYYYHGRYDYHGRYWYYYGSSQMLPLPIIGKGDFQNDFTTKNGRAMARTMLAKVSCDGQVWKAKRGPKLPI